MIASQQTRRWLTIGGGALSMALTVSVPLLVEHMTAPSRWLQEEARLCAHVRSRAAQNISLELGRQAAMDSALNVRDAMAAVADRSGHSNFVCPVSGDPYRVLPDASSWMSARPTTVALVCDCERHPDDLPRATSVFGFDVALPPEARLPWEERSRVMTAALRANAIGTIEQVGYWGK